MEQHPSFPAVRLWCDRYPHQSLAIFQAYTDLLHAQQWQGLHIRDLPGARCVVIKGEKGPNGEERTVLPMALERQTSIGQLSQIFEELGDRDEGILLGIVGPDSSIVYYDLRKGVVSPKEVPD